MKSVLISIRPKWCDLTASGEKTIEVRKTRPKIETPFKCYIYETKGRSDMPTFVDEDGHVLYTGRGQVIGEFICDQIIDIVPIQGGGYVAFGGELSDAFLSHGELTNFLKENGGYGWHISDLKIYDKPRELSEFYKECNFDKCESCPHLYVENTPSSYETWCEFDEKMPIARPPQSWCYVEEV